MTPTLRPATDADLPLLLTIYASTRADELALVPWTDAQKLAFVQMQFHAQHTYYHQQWPEAAYSVVEVDGQPVGRLYLRREPNALHIIDIALLPAFRGAGVGTHLLRAVLAEAGAAGVPVSIHVEKTNRARALYARLGFQFVSENGFYDLMVCQPGPTCSTN